MPAAPSLARSRRSATSRPYTRVGHPIICAVSSRRLFGSDAEGACEALVRWSGLVARAGVSFVQIREYDLPDAQLIGLVRAICAATAATSAKVIVSDRTDVALAAGAAGVHLPAAAPPASRVRAIVPDGFVIGRSVHSEEEAVAAAESGGCDYLTFGTVFESQSKPADHPVAGIEALARVVARVPLPIVAIGGVTVERADGIARAGAAGIAAIRLFAEAPVASDADAETRIHEMVAAIEGAFASVDRGEAADAAAGDSEEELSEAEAATPPTQLSSLPVVQRMKLAMKGTREQRAQLIRDPNRMVATAVLSSPKVNESEIEAFAKMGNVSEDVLRIIATNRAWVKSYGIVLSLTRNPKTPPALSMQMLHRLMERDVKVIASDRNVPEAVRLAARRIMTKSVR
jgi:thiamine-phosphate pyrophosphorylase